MSYLSIDPTWRARVQAFTRRVHYLDGFEMLMATIYQQRYDGTPLIAADRKEQCVEAIWSVLAGFEATEFDILVLRFGLLNNRIATLPETARVLELSVEQVRQDEAKALRKLTHNSCRRQLDAFVSFATESVY